VLLNNDGGGIFQRLPVSKHDPEFTEYFATPHGLAFAPVAELYGLSHVVADSRAVFRAAVAASFEAQKRGESTLIEVRSDARADLFARADFLKQLRV
jgi:2-succinyl-5-enolpyruvyl-6-hydroxy-3-cyclohexene-1-carboxylate synthase